ncbi:MAG: hypothetical protein P1P88_15150 [Bacteroidales bacterium]|nr:hypothetical protein [Bacteroidales bacterium]
MKQTKVAFLLFGLALILLVVITVLNKTEIMDMPIAKYSNIWSFLHIWSPFIGILFVAIGAFLITQTIK